MDDTLSIPDCPAWCRETGYSPDVASALVGAYRAIASAGQDRLPAAYLHAEDVLRPCLSQPMSLRQRMLVSYILGLACVMASDYHLAIARFDDALEMAMHLHDLRAGIELSHLNSQLFWELEELACAARYADLSIEILRTPGGDETDGVLADANLTLDILARAALIEWFRGRYGPCTDRVNTARRTAEATAAPPTTTAVFAWLQALLLQSRGDGNALYAALRHALSAAEKYGEMGSTGSQVRIATVVADIALDLAEQSGAGHSTLFPTSAQTFLTLARSHLTNALDLARATADEPGECLALLAFARLARLRSEDIHRVTLLESVHWTADRLTDAALQGQTYVALGAEFAAQGESERARSCYRSAVDVLSKRGIGGLAWRARRVLLISEEMGVH